MKKTVQLEGHQVEVDTSAGWFYEYLEQFGHDIMPDIMPLIESIVIAISSVLEESSGRFDEKELLKAMNNDALVDAFIKMSGMEFTTVLNIFWAMAKNCSAATPQPKEFYKSLPVLPLDTLMPQLLHMIIESCASSKNAKSLLEKIDKLTKKNGESTSTPSASQASTEG